MNIKNSIILYTLPIYVYLGIFSSSDFIHNFLPLMRIVKLSMSVLMVLMITTALSSIKTYKELTVITIALAYSFIKQDLTTINITAIIIICLYIYRNNLIITDYFKALKPLYIASFLGIISVYLLEFLGVSQKQSFYIYTSGINKHALGFYNPNALGIYCLSICSYILLLSNKKILDYVIFAVTLYFLHLSGARTTIYSFYLIFILYIPSTLNLLDRQLRLIIYPISSLIILVGYIVFILAIIFDKEYFFLGDYFSKIDYWTSFRLSLLKSQVGDLSVIELLFGVYNPIPIEMGWYHLTVSFGAVLLIIILGLNVIHSIIKQPKTTFYTGLVLVFLISNLFENFFITYNLLVYIVFFKFYDVILSFKWR